MYEDSHINQVSFTTHRHPTEYLRCDIHHVGDMQPQNASSQTETHPLPKSQQSNTPKPIQPLETIPAPADGKSEKHAAHLNS
jgi:conserved domain protein